MIIREVLLPGAFVVEPEPIEDERGFFARSYGKHEFEAQGLETQIAHTSLAFNRLRGTLRGMHYQVAPFEECKLVRCTRGGIYDVLVDLRPDSPTYCRWFGVELTAENRLSLYVPVGVAHGYMALADESEVLYQISAEYSPEHARGVRWDDPAFAIEWPEQPVVISDRDRSHPDFRP
jgi:dTDP-4-dehydrorhamnose 3,5-epimerase